jgi:hypothetical protein
MEFAKLVSNPDDIEEHILDLGDLSRDPFGAPAAAAAGGGGAAPAVEPEEPYLAAPTDLRVVAMFSFADILAQFAVAVQGAFSRHKALRDLVQQYNDRVTDESDEPKRRKYIHDCVVAFQRGFKPYFSSINRRDMTQLAGAADTIPLLHRLQAGRMWRAATPAIQETVADYVYQLARFANTYYLYIQFPPTMFPAAHRVATSVAEQMRGSGGKMKRLTLDKITSWGRQAIEQTSAKDQKAFTEYLQDPKNLDDFWDLVRVLLERNGNDAFASMGGLSSILSQVSGGGGAPAKLMP